MIAQHGTIEDVTVETAEFVGIRRKRSVDELKLLLCSSIIGGCVSIE
jgi:hypothetical protein